MAMAKKKFLKPLIMIVCSVLIVIGLIVMVFGWPIIWTISGKEYLEMDQAICLIENKERDTSSIQKGERFKDYDPGDTIRITDKIDIIVYNETSIGNDIMKSTLIYLKSEPNRFLRIEGDITGEFKKGDSILIKLYVVKHPLYRLEGEHPGFTGNDPFYFKEKLDHERGYLVHDGMYSAIIPQDQISKPPDTMFYFGVSFVIIGAVIIIVRIISKKRSRTS